MQERIKSSIKKQEDMAPPQMAGTRPTEEEKDAFFCKWKDRLTEFGNDSRTTKSRMDYADSQLCSLFDELMKMTNTDFPADNPKETDLELPGNYGDSTPQKPRKRGRF